MDTIATIIVTAFINILITGIVSNLIFYRYQKKIEATFARSSFEYQTKFSQTYPKTLEVLETFIGKFNRFFGAYSGLTNRIKLSLLSASLPASYRSLDRPLKQEEVEVYLERIQTSIFDFQIHFSDNSIYIPDSLVQEIKNVIGRMENLHRYLRSYLLRSDRTPQEILEHMRKLIKDGHMKFPDEEALAKIVPTDERAVMTFIEILDNELEKLSALLEKLYKSLIDTKTLSVK